MSRLLHIQASPRGERSASLAVAKRFIEAYVRRRPETTVETLDVWKADLPAFDGAALNAKYAVLSGAAQTPEQREAWDAVTRAARRFASADVYLISLPMWNFGIPYRLKHYIDVVTQPGLTFSFSPESGYSGLVTGRPAVAVYARGGAYAPGTGAEAYDAQSPYLRQMLGFVGFTDIHEIFVEPTLGGPDSLDRAVTTGTRAAEDLAARL